MGGGDTAAVFSPGTIKRSFRNRLQSPPSWGLDSGRKTSGSSPLGSASARQAARTHLCTFSDALVGSDLGSPGLDRGKCLASYQVCVLRPWSLQGPEANMIRWALSAGGRGAGRLRGIAVCLYKELCVCVEGTRLLLEQL